MLVFMFPGLTRTTDMLYVLCKLSERFSCCPALVGLSLIHSHSLFFVPRSPCNPKPSEKLAHSPHLQSLNCLDISIIESKTLEGTIK